MKTEIEEAKKTREKRALMFASLEDSEIDEMEVPTPRRRQNKGTDVKAGLTQHSPDGSGDSVRKWLRRKASSST